MTAPYRLPFGHDHVWNIVSGTGNWDDPGGGNVHGYYAYDIGLPEGHKIRAARSGKVIALANDRDHGSEAGSGGGNFVYIEHFDGTVASYAHMLKNSVLVQDNQWVNQGQVIGRASDSGQSGENQWHIHFQVMTSAKNETEVGASIPFVFEDLTHDSWRPVAGNRLKSNNMTLRQENWRWCKNCQGLFLGGSSVPGILKRPIGKCPASSTGGGHDGSDSGCYILAASEPVSIAPAKTQGKWRFCKNCRGLFFGGNPGSRCHAGNGAHDGSASDEYFVSFTSSVTPGQKNWRWCVACQGLFFAGGSASKCPATGGAHNPAGSGDYTLQEVAELKFAQTDWRWCDKCHGLFFNHVGSVCPKDKKPHNHLNHLPYTVLMEPVPVAGQKGWRWCNACHGMFFGGNPGLACPAGPPGTPHNGHGSGHYVLHLDQPNAPGHKSWAWCAKCQGLYLDRLGLITACPADGGPHQNIGSGNYTVYGWAP